MIQPTTSVNTPAWLFQDTTGQIITPKYIQVAVAPSATNVLCVTGVAGKIVRVISMTGSANAGTTAVLLINGSGGAGLMYVPCPIYTSNVAIFPPSEIGWVDTTVGTGLYANNAGAAFAGALTIGYITFTPAG